MTIDEFVAALKTAAPDFRWTLERQRWGNEDRDIMTTKIGDMKTCPIGAVAYHLGKGKFDVAGYTQAAEKIKLHWRDRRRLSFAICNSPMADVALRGRLLAQIDLR